MTVKDFLKQFSRRQEPHVIINEDGEPLGVVLSYDRYAELTQRQDSSSVRGRTVQANSIPHAESSFQTGPIHVEPMQKTEPAPFRWDAATEESDEPQFQFEPIEEEEGLTS